jgi:hypothetical protein
MVRDHRTYQPLIAHSTEQRIECQQPFDQNQATFNHHTKPPNAQASAKGIDDPAPPVVRFRPLEGVTPQAARG